MGIVAQLYRDARHGERYPVALEATLRDAGPVPFDAAIEDLSVSGFRVSAPAELTVGDEIAIGIAGIGVRKARVARSDGTVHGCEFLLPLTNPQLATALEAPPAELIPWPGNVSVTRVEAKPMQPSVLQLTVLSLFGLLLVGGFGWGVIAATRAIL